MLEKINLRHLIACNQSWSEMSPTERGRLCGKCNKIIIDFREMTDSEVAHVHVFEDRNVCGVYRPDQLKLTPDRIHPDKVNSWKLACRKGRSIAIGITGLLSAVNVSGQNESATISTEQIEINPTHKSDTPVEKNNTEIYVPQDSIIISGTVSNAEGGAIQYGIVVVKGTENGTVTSLDGFYSLDITDHIFESGETTLEFRYLGYMDTLVHLNLDSLHTQASRIIDVAFPDYSIETNVKISQFYVSIEPEKKSLWQKFLNLFKRKNKKDK